MKVEGDQRVYTNLIGRGVEVIILADEGGETLRLQLARIVQVESRMGLRAEPPCSHNRLLKSALMPACLR